MPRVASEASVSSAPHLHFGARSRAANAERHDQASPFAELLDAATDASPSLPPPPDRSEGAPKSRAARTAAAGETAADKPTSSSASTPMISDTKPTDAGSIDPAGAEIAKAHAFGETADAEATNTDAKAKAGATDVPTVAKDKEPDPTGPAAPTDPALTALAVDPGAPPPTPPPAATVAPDLPIKAEPTPDGDDSMTTDADPPRNGPKIAEAPKDLPPADAPKEQPAADGSGQAPPSEALHAGMKANATQGAAKAPGTRASAVGSKESATDSKGSDTTSTAGAAATSDKPDTTETDDPKAIRREAGAPPDALPQDKTEHAHLRPTTDRTDAEKTDRSSSETLGRLVSEAAAGGKPPVEAVQAVLRANDVAFGARAPSAQAAATTDAAVPIAGLAVAIAARAEAGSNRFEIRLDPPELGRIDVRLDVDRNGNVSSRLVVDRAETLDILRRDAGDLQRALQQAGLKTSDNGLSFSLRDQGFAGREQNQDSRNAARLFVPDPELAAAEPVRGYGRLLVSGGGVDIRV